jgi:hypothetical protein
MTAIAIARTSHALENIDLCGIALRAGWRAASVLRPDEMPFAGALLQLAGTFIPIRVVVNTGEDMSSLLNHLHYDVLHGCHREQFILMLDFAPDVVRAYRASFVNVRTVRVTVGALLDFRLWVLTRLGPLGKIPLTSSVRRLTEQMLVLRATPDPTKKRTLVGDYRGSPYESSMNQGAFGVQAAATLFSFTHGEENVKNVEKVPQYQKQDVDLLVYQPGPGKLVTKVELKAEDYDENMAAENKPNKDAEKQGWLHDSEMDVLGTLFLPTGELLLTDFHELKAWVYANRNDTSLMWTKLREGGAKGQKHKSSFWAIPVNDLMAELQGMVRIRLQDWLPTLYGEEEFKRSGTTNIEQRFVRFKTIRPTLRLEFPMSLPG